MSALLSGLPLSLPVMDFRKIKVLNVDDLSVNRFNCQAKEKII